jgi:hypothetical protein
VISVQLSFCIFIAISVCVIMLAGQQVAPAVIDGGLPPLHMQAREPGELPVAAPLPTAALVEFLAAVDLPVVRSPEFCRKIAAILAVRWQPVLAQCVSIILLPLLA